VPHYTGGEKSRGPAAGEVKESLSPLLRCAFLGVGLLCLLLAFLGFVLPGLPTTPFLLLAAACFARSSPRLHGWLLANRHFGPLLKNWEETRSLPRRVKRLAIAMVLVAAAVSLCAFEGLAFRLFFLAGLAIPLTILVRLKESEALLAGERAVADQE